ncbi:hypothetical protein [Vibrio phage vB_VpaP_SJSY21]|nr:hypothetical protein [Vibrio phage vB_VpaP_SJSY21]
MDDLKVGTIVRLWTMASEYGVIYKVNHKSFWVSTNLHGRVKFSREFRYFDDYLCMHKVHRLSMLYDCQLSNKKFISDLLSEEKWSPLYKGRWWPGIKEEVHKIYAPLAQ